MHSFDSKPPSSHRSIGGKASNLTPNNSLYGIGLSPGYPKLEPKTPPRTPTQAKSKASTMSKAEGRRLQSQLERETFADEKTPTMEARSNGGYEEEQRHSHDLSIPTEQGTRDSLVENMLFSLNGSDGAFGGLGNMSVDEARLYSSFADNTSDGYRYGSSGGGRGQVRGVHGHSLSTSDYGNEERPSSQYTMTRERRSVSSGAFTMTNGKGTSMAQQRVGGNNTLPRTAGKGSKGSGGGSFDLGYAEVTSNQRWAQGYAGGRRRSSSMEGYGHDNVLANLVRQQAAQPKDLEPYDHYEAAPTPIIPREPRRLDSATSRPESPLYMHSPVKEMGRKRSTSNRNGTAAGLSGKRAETSDRPERGGNPLDQSRRLPPLPAFKQEPPQQKGKNMPSSGQTAPKQEKQGFFRRVFGVGSSKNLNALTQTETASSASNASTASRENTPIARPEPRPEVSNKNASYRSATSHGHPLPGPPLQPQISAKEAYHSTQQTLKKTPSSFFRRRKKSVSEMALPPLPLPPKTLDFDQLGRMNSPTGSLMGAMKPFMDRDSPTRPNALRPAYGGESGRYVSDSADTEEEKEDVRSFSPQWNPDKNATIRSVDSPRRDITQAFPKSNLGPEAALVTDEDLDRTFLHESSDNEPGPISPVKDRNVSQSLTLKPDTGREGANSPALSHVSRQESKTARDIQMVQEYNDKFAQRTNPVRSNTGQSSLLPSQSSIGSPQSERGSQRAVNEVVEKMEKMDPELQPSEVESEDEVVIVSPTREMKKSERLRLEPTLSEENMAKTRLGKIDTTLAARHRTGTVESSQSTPNVWYSATELPLAGQDSTAQTPLSPAPPTININENERPTYKFDTGLMEPTTEDRDRAKKIYDGNEDFILKSKAAAWIGEDSPARCRTLHAYMSLYDFKDMNILTALRALCNRLLLRAESQQVDRILVEFSKRWCECNEKNGFKSWDVVHTICYSLLLLNTDLHMADIENKMTRGQFVKNALPTILQVVEAAEGKEEAESKESKRPSIMIDTFRSPEDDAAEAQKKKDEENPGSRGRGNSLEISGEKPSWRLSLRPGAARTNADSLGAPSPLQYNTGGNDCGPLVKAPFHGTLRTWEVQIEIVLKDFYNAIKAESLPLFDAENQRPTALQNRSQSSTLSVFGTGMLRRTPSVISKAGSESGYVRGRTAEGARLNTGKWSTKNGRNRSRVNGAGSIYPSSLMGGSRTSLDDNSSIWSPSGLSSGTSGWGSSKYSLGKTHTSLSVNSLGSAGDGDFHQSIGFANALSHAIIKEEYPSSDTRSVLSARTNLSSTKAQINLLDDPSLELEGAPWGKEGLLKHKHHLDADGKRAKERSWNEVFAVINQGSMCLFSFSSAKSQRLKSKANAPGRGAVVVGGGNWQDGAESLGRFELRQTIASALPAPGYSKQRPWVFALSLPGGAVHLFQVGTQRIVGEWVETANYWAARLSTHPLVGGISNIEYGWSEAVINTSVMEAINEAPVEKSRPPVAMDNKGGMATGRNSISGGRPSIQSSLRSSLDLASGATFRPRLPADKVAISEWTPPTQSMRASTLSEVEQLAYLTEYVGGVEEELSKHQMVRGGMGLAFSTRSPNASKATGNWERKSSYLLREIVRFGTYIDTLGQAARRREEVYGERRVREAEREVEREGREEGGKYGACRT